MSRELWLKAPAKINLTLEITGRLRDGYHHLEMVMTTIDLADRIYIREREDERIILTTTSPHLPTDEKNLAFRAARLFQAWSGVRRGVEMELQKHIPVAAGLGGGSSNAAAVLIGLSQLWDIPISLSDMMQLALQLGSDVPFFLYQQTAHVSGRGEIIHPLPPLPPYYVVLARPPRAVSTGTIFHAFAEMESPHPPIYTPRMVEAIYARDSEKILSLLTNDLEKITFHLYPEVSALKNNMVRFGAEHVLMSGSGPTVFALFTRYSQARRVYHALRGYLKDVWLLHTLRGQPTMFYAHHRV